jgi:hypothetical protein
MTYRTVEPRPGIFIPILGEGEPLTDDYISVLDGALRSDGCTGVKDWHRPCCVVHDLACEHHLDPWGRVITRAAGDVGLRRCIQSRSHVSIPYWPGKRLTVNLGRLSPMSWWRWAGVRSYAILTGKQ